MNIRKLILKLFRGVPIEEHIQVLEQVIINNKTSINRLYDWRRGMSMRCMDIDGVRLADEQIRKIIKDLPINLMNY